ncbi:MAG: hypothetical protein EOO47_06470 [Flavobacterium sp.]|nr:MAG: hypothetical protein EOO47_06470 [Flavobacterium sp.]
MKKTLFVIMLLFIANMGCKKMTDTDRLCACSPISYPSLNLVVKSAAETDLLDSKNAGSFAKEQIQVYYKDANGNNKAIPFHIRPPFSFDKEEFKFNQLVVPEIFAISKNIDKFYLKLGDQTPLELKVQFSATTGKFEKLLIDGKEATFETGKVANYIHGGIFYLVK